MKVTPFNKKTAGRLQRNDLQVALLLAGLLLTFFNMYVMELMMVGCNKHSEASIPTTVFIHTPASGEKAVVSSHAVMDMPRKPVVWIRADHLDRHRLRNVMTVFERLGFTIEAGNKSQDWDVLWSFRGPFVKSTSNVMTNLKEYQKVNHLPASWLVNLKSELSTLDVKANPLTFKIPRDKNMLLKYTGEFPNMLWVQKNKSHRGINLVNVNKLDLESEDILVQEFIDRPLLLDGRHGEIRQNRSYVQTVQALIRQLFQEMSDLGLLGLPKAYICVYMRKFDIGVFTVVTSLEPLRIYILPDKLHIRSCLKEYYPFDVSDRNKYIIENYTPLWKVPALKDLYFKSMLSSRDIIESYFHSQGKNLKKVWPQIEETIGQIYLKQNSRMLSRARKYISTRPFFELVRFDFVLDEDLKVYLMEVNMSPNLSSIDHPENRLLYEQVVYNTLRVSGVASMADTKFHNSDGRARNMQVSDRDISVFSDWCAGHNCVGNCASMQCMLCIPCLSTSSRQIYKDAYLEHINRGSCSRVFPPKLNRTEALKWTPKKDIYNLSQYSESIRRMFLWFIGMCRKDVKFCM